MVQKVLILVLVEDGLRVERRRLLALLYGVLILVLVEDGLRAMGRLLVEYHGIVLILVLVEDGLRAGISYALLNGVKCLNPCFSGRWSASIRMAELREEFDYVLILVLVEDGLRGSIMS